MQFYYYFFITTSFNSVVSADSTVISADSTVEPRYTIDLGGGITLRTNDPDAASKKYTVTTSLVVPEKIRYYDLYAKSLTVGEEYTIKVKVYDKYSKQLVVNAYGDPVEATYSFVAENKEQIVSIPLNFSGVKKDFEGIIEKTFIFKLGDKIFHDTSTEEFVLTDKKPSTFNGLVLPILIIVSILIIPWLVYFIYIKAIRRKSQTDIDAFTFEATGLKIDNDEDDDFEDTYEELDNSEESIMFTCKFCGQKVILKGDYEGAVPKCPQCGGIL